MNVHVMSASAGSGKTYWLTEHLADALLGGGPGDVVRPEGVLAITYTRKAAAELESRLRRRLIRAGEWRLAHVLADGYIGTIHAVCQRLLREFALEGGLSPDQRVIPESEEARLFREALGAVIGDDDHAELDAAARRLSLGDWRDVVRRVVDYARANGLDRAELERSRARSWDGLRRLLPEPADDAGEWDRELRAELETVRRELDAQAVESRAAGERLRAVDDLIHEIGRDGVASWRQCLVVVKKLAGVKKLEYLVSDLCDLLDRHAEDPRFHEDLRRVTDGVFGLAADVLDAYGARKRAARILDYGDMLAHALALLERPSVRDALAERLDLVLVDEFQDVSPLQLALVTRLSALAGRAAWVGDPKQAIFGFQGSDPELMAAAMTHALGGAEPDVLERSYRSRPELVRFCSELFARALAAHGYTERQVRLEPANEDPPALERVPVLECWAWDPTSTERDGRRIRPNEAHAVAAGVEALLAEAPPVREKPDDDGEIRVRPLRRRDVAVLVRTNARARDVAAALRDRGVPAAVALGGLMEQPEARLARAALALVADPQDGVAAAEVIWLSGGASADPDGWLTARIQEEAAWRARRDGSPPGEDVGPPPLPFDDDARVRALRELAGRIAGRSPSEAFTLALDAVGLHRLCLAWPDGARRLANLEALRAEAAAYEELCRVQRSACTVAGLVAHLANGGSGGPGASGRPGGAGGGWRRDDGAEQAMPTDLDAVAVTTYHRAKGLEWPVVVLTQLDSEPKADAFGLQVEPRDGDFDPERPLEGRWLRYWPYPYGGHVKDVPLREAADATPAARRVQERDARERARLLYVGATRARDRLVLVARAGEGVPAATAWLDELRDAGGRPAASLPWTAAEGAAVARVAGSDDEWPCTVRRPAGLPPERPASVEAGGLWFAVPDGPPPARPPEIVGPSGLSLPPDAFRVAGIERIGPRAELAGRPEESGRLGDVVHAFLAADLPGPGDAAAREAMARRLLEAVELLAVLPAPDLVRMADALARWIRTRFPDARVLCEWPVRWRLPDPSLPDTPRLLIGEVDLVLETPDGLVVVDHKTYGGDDAGRDARMPRWAGQLAAYAAALESATGRPVTAAYVHLPVLGEVVEVEPRLVRGLRFHF